MSQANRIRQFAVDHFIAPAIAAGRDEITIRAGDVHRGMGLTNAMPAVCSALGSRKLDEYAKIVRSALVGPANGANVYFTFNLSGRAPHEQILRKRREPAPLVAPNAEIALYDYTLNSLGVSERQAWAKDVLKALLPVLTNEKRAVMFAGDRYREFLIEPLQRNGIEVEVPMAHLRRGEQLSWLSNFQ